MMACQSLSQLSPLLKLVDFHFYADLVNEIHRIILDPHMREELQLNVFGQE